MNNLHRERERFIGLVKNGTTFPEYQDCARENMSKQDWQKKKKQ